MARGARAGAGGEPPTKLEIARKKLAPFLAANPASSVEEIVTPKVTEIQVLKPWGDFAVGLRVPDPPGPLADALNKLLLPERLSALWHSDTNELEVIWTAQTLSANWKEISGRKFVFTFKGKKHICEFKKSSKRLETIAGSSFQRLSSSTDWRNLPSFAALVRNPANPYLDKPLSFWISNIKWKEDAVIELIANLNFYLSYYDDLSPTVRVFPPLDIPVNSKGKTRYVAGKFPTSISGEGLDENLLNFWNGADTVDPLLRFIIYYRIIEYASAHYLDSTIRSELKKILLAPDRKSDPGSVIDRISDVVRMDKLDEPSKFKGVVKLTCHPKLIWREISENIDFFSKELVFDGGFKIPPLVSKDDTEGPFCARGLTSFTESIRKIRNALSHGKDQETAGVITPTTRNLRNLTPWVHLIGTVAGEVVLYKGTS